MTEQAARPLRIGDGAGWHFVNGDWHDGPDGALLVADEARRADGPHMQGHHTAFAPEPGYRDVRVRFAFRLSPHTEVGIVLRATDASHFYLLHFPNCGQASRAQHFWAAFSLMDSSGYLRCIKTEPVRRVASNDNLWLTAEVTLTGRKVSVRIGEHGHFEAEDDTYTEPGRIGLFTFGERNAADRNAFGDSEIRAVTVTGEPTGSAWNDAVRQPTHWYHPCPDTEHGLWQRPRDLLQFPDGELLLSYAVQERPFQGTITPLLARSHDGGSTWTPPEVQPKSHDSGWQPDRLHLTPRGRLIALRKVEKDFFLLDSPDRGRTWSPPVPAGIGPTPPHIEEVHIGPQAMLNLADGGILLLGYGVRTDLRKPEIPVYAWGSRQSQAFACRSADDGRTWSPWVNLDNAGRDFRFDPAVPGRRLGEAMDGNMDLTEVCAVQTGDGRVLALVRPIYSPWMWETWSADGGVTWDSCVPGPFPGYATPNLLRTRAGALLVAHRQPTLTVHVSHDDGHTWDTGTMIDSGVWAMGALVETAPDVVLYIYWDSFTSLMRAQRFRVTRAGLEPLPRAQGAAVA